MNKIFLSLVILLSVLVVMFALAFSFYLLDSKTTEIEQPKPIYLKSIFGCLKTSDKLTNAQWEAKQKFTRDFLGFQYVRCNDGSN